MGCDKRYGLREVWVAPEASPNTPATFTSDNYLQHCTGSNFPAVYRQNLENQEATGNRGQSQAFDGAQNELSWDVTVMLPDSTAIGSPASLPESLQSLFWAAGFGSDTGPAYWTPALTTAEKMVIKAGSACGRTLQLVGLDRDKRHIEILTGAVVSQLVFTFSRSDVCTLQISGVAARKFEATAPVLTSADDGNDIFSAAVRSSYDAALETSPAILTGVSLVLGSEPQELATMSGVAQTISIKSAFSTTITADTPTSFDVPKPTGSGYSVLSPDAWSLGDLESVQSATLTMETGQNYGELTTQAQYPTEILSGQVKITASVTAYIVDLNTGALDYDSGYPLSFYFAPGKTGTALKIASAKFTEYPALDLSDVDTPASGDFGFAAGETGTLITDGALDTLYLS